MRVETYRPDRGCVYVGIGDAKRARNAMVLVMGLVPSQGSKVQGLRLVHSPDLEWKSCKISCGQCARGHIRALQSVKVAVRTIGLLFTVCYDRKKCVSRTDKVSTMRNPNASGWVRNVGCRMRRVREWMRLTAAERTSHSRGMAWRTGDISSSPHLTSPRKSCAISCDVQNHREPAQTA